jgi:RNA-binding protein Musashi
MEVVIMYDQEKKKSRGFGFLSFAEEEACCKAVADHFVTIQNKQVEIKRAEPRSNQAQGDRGGLDGAPLEQWGAPPLMANGHHQPGGHPHMLASQAVAHHNPPPPASPYATWGAPQGPPAQPVPQQPQPTAYPTQYGPAQPQVHHVQGPPPSGWGQPPPVAVQAPPHAAAPAPHWGPTHMQTYASPPPAATPQPAPQYQTVYPAVPAAAAPQQHPSAAQQYWGAAPAPGDPYAAQPRSDPYAAYAAPPAAAAPQPGATVAYPYQQYHPHAAMVAAAAAKAPLQPAYAAGPPAGEYYAPATSPPVAYPGSVAPAPTDMATAGGLGPQRPAYGTQPSPYHPYRRT